MKFVIKANKKDRRLYYYSKSTGVMVYKVGFNDIVGFFISE